MITIHKYPLHVSTNQVVYLPREHKILCVQPQYNDIFMWVLINTETPLKAVRISVHGTGQRIPELDFTPPDLEQAGTYLGTVQQGGFVWHVFLDL